MGTIENKFKLTPFGKRVFLQRYAMRDEKNEKILELIPEDTFIRVAAALAAVDVYYWVKNVDHTLGKSSPEIIQQCNESLIRVIKNGEKVPNTTKVDIYIKGKRDVMERFNEYYKIMVNKEFCPAGRTLANCGINDGVRKVVPNCIVLHIEDSLIGPNSIMRTLQDAVILQRQGSGLGFPWHLLRPAGEPTKMGTSSGPISFLKAYNQFFSVIKQQNRHGANMAVMSVEHPDILEFIECKQEEGSMHCFNVSVGLTDRFMKQAIDKSNKTPWMCEWKGEKRQISRITKDMYGHIIGREKMDITASDLLNLICKHAWKNGEPGAIFLDTVNKTNPLPGLGTLQCCNPCFAGDTIIETVEGPIEISKISKPMMVYSMDKDGKLVLKQCSAAFKTKINTETLKINLSNGKSLVVTPDHKIFAGKFRRAILRADQLKDGRWIKANELIRGMYVVGLCRYRRGYAYSGVRLSLQSLSEIQMEHRFIWENMYGSIPKGYDIHHKDNNSYHNSISNFAMVSHNVHSRYSISIRSNDHQVQCEKTGRFVQSGKRGKKTIINMPAHLKSNWTSTPRIISITVGPVQDVWDIQVEDTHNMIASGVVAHNCGEQFLHDGDVCNLGAINLGAMVTSDRKLDLGKLAQVTTIAVRMLDNVIDLLDCEVERVRWMYTMNRRIGLGIMGLADMLFKMRIGYDTENGRKLAGTAMATINEYAVKESRRRSETRGVFVNWTKSSYYIKKQPKQRNAALTNIAPTGTTAAFFGVNGGCEPYFALAYNYTNVLSSVEDEHFQKAYTKNGHTNGHSMSSIGLHAELLGALQEVYLTTEKLSKIQQEIIKTGSLQQIDSVPDWIKEVFVTAMDIDPMDHLLMQAELQKHCDNSISKTNNLPFEATVKDVRDLFVSAWKHEIKGFTVYRNGSRQHQVINLNSKDSEEENIKCEVLPNGGAVCLRCSGD